MRADNGIFSPDHYRAVRRPLLEAETMPAWCYTSRAFYDREVERIFLREWNFIGRADRIPNHGDYFTLEFAGVPVVVVRGKDGAVRAFSNVCRHRGARIMSGEGNANGFRCPYHSWSYGLDGRLERAPEMHETRGFELSDYALKPVRLETWAGFMFISFDPDGVDLMTFLGDLPEMTAPYRFEDMTCVRRREYDLSCNWKIYVGKRNGGVPRAIRPHADNLPARARKQPSHSLCRRLLRDLHPPRRKSGHPSPASRGFRTFPP